MSAYLCYVYVRLVALIVGVVVNAFTLFIIIYNAKLRHQRNIFTFNLALADFVAATCEILRATLISGKLIDCTQIIFHCAILVSVMSILAVACYRFISIAFDPFGSRNLVTTRRCVVGCIVMWIATTLPLLILFYCSTVYRAILFTMMPIIILTSLGVTAFCYCMTYMDIASASGKQQAIGGTDQIKGRVKENRKVLLTFAVITLTSSVCWIVHCFHDILQIYAIYYDNIDAVSNILVALNFVIDPVIYWWRLDEFRAVLVKMMCMSAVARRLRKAGGRVDDSSSSSSQSTKVFTMADESKRIAPRLSPTPSISEM
nr:C-X-C chemokine receptor type 2-like [Lytechinus pictus]